MSNLTSTIRLFARPSFLEGMARFLDFSGSLQVYNENKTAKDLQVIFFKTIRIFILDPNLNLKK